MTISEKMGVYADDFTEHMSPRLALEYRRWYPFCKESVLATIDRLPDLIAQRWNMFGGMKKNAQFAEMLQNVIVNPYRSYHLRSGKMLRPFLVCFLLKALGYDPYRYPTVVAIAEIIHAASLVFDDIADDSALRRGAPTAHQMVGVRVAGSMASTWLHAALPLLASVEERPEDRRTELIHELAWEHWVTGFGTTIDTTWAWREHFDATPMEYMQSVVHRSASYTYRLPFKIATIVAGVEKKQRTTLIAFGEEIGLAFQVMDDILNLRSTDEAWGKELAEDLSQGKITLQIILALNLATESHKHQLQKILKARTHDQAILQQAVRIIEECGAFEAASKRNPGIIYCSINLRFRRSRLLFINNL